MDFVINAPEASGTTVAFVTGGNVNTVAGKNGQLDTRCLTDVFSVSNPGGPSPPQICGNHYVARILFHFDNKAISSFT